MPSTRTDHATQIDGTDARLAFDVPLQDGLLNAHVELNADWQTNPVFNATVRVPLTAADGSPAQLAGLVPDVEDLSILGEVLANVSGDSEGALATASITVDRLEMPANSLVLTDLSTSCSLRFSGEPRSLPEQLLSVDSLSVGDFHVEKIRMHYQLEPESVLFVEDLEFNWCDGRVSLYNSRIRPGITNVAVQLLCDRLSLQQVLSSCGLEGFSAGGELNGRLPIRWKNGELTIDRGFLFTTPGKGGTFAFGAAEVAAGILPPGSMESGQIGLVTDWFRWGSIPGGLISVCWIRMESCWGTRSTIGMNAPQACLKRSLKRCRRKRCLRKAESSLWSSTPSTS